MAWRLEVFLSLFSRWCHIASFGVFLPELPLAIFEDLHVPPSMASLWSVASTFVIAACASGGHWCLAVDGIAVITGFAARGKRMADSSVASRITWVSSATMAGVGGGEGTGFMWCHLRCCLLPGGHRHCWSWNVGFWCIPLSLLTGSELLPGAQDYGVCSTSHGHICCHGWLAGWPELHMCLHCSPPSSLGMGVAAQSLQPGIQGPGLCLCWSSIYLLLCGPIHPPSYVPKCGFLQSPDVLGSVAFVGLWMLCSIDRRGETRDPLMLSWWWHPLSNNFLNQMVLSPQLCSFSELF